MEPKIEATKTIKYWGKQAKQRAIDILIHAGAIFRAANSQRGFPSAILSGVFVHLSFGLVPSS